MTRMRALSLGVLQAVALAMLFGCESSDDSSPQAYWNEDGTSVAANGSDTDAPPAGDSSPGQVPADFAGVVWLHANVSGWAQTGSLGGISISGDMINLPYDKAKVWPPKGDLNANPWIFVWQDGTWYAATWEWLRFGQTSKAVAAVNGDHIKKPPLDNFSPVSGTSYGFMVSGLARDDTRNVSERTNVVMFRWP